MVDAVAIWPFSKSLQAVIESLLAREQVARTSRNLCRQRHVFLLPQNSVASGSTFLVRGRRVLFLDQDEVGRLAFRGRRRARRRHWPFHALDRPQHSIRSFELQSRGRALWYPTSETPQQAQ